MPTICKECHHTGSMRVDEDDGDCQCPCHDVADAGPELLAACEQLRAAFMAGCGDALNGLKRDRLVKAGAAMDAAIAKATGKPYKRRPT